MAINYFNLKKWIKLILNRSYLHLNQDVGNVYSLKDISGYYNDLTLKVIHSNNKLSKTKLTQKSATEYFSINVFQFGLGAYDLYIQSKNIKYLESFNECVRWTVNNQLSDGGWMTFQTINKKEPFSAMAQGQGISLLIRAFILTKDKTLLNNINLAYEFLLKPLELGGPTKLNTSELVFFEFTYKKPVLNGWIFAIFGLYDYMKFFSDRKSKDTFILSIETLKNYLPLYDNGFWSNYYLNRIYPVLFIIN